MQFSTAGPMIIADHTDEDLEILRNVVTAQSKIKYLAFYKCTGSSRILLVLAQAQSRLTPRGWLECVHARLENIKPTRNMHRLVRCVQHNLDFEQFGTPKWQVRALPKIVVKTSPQDDTSPYQIARKYFLMTLGIAPKPDYARKSRGAGGMSSSTLVPS